MTRNFLLTLSAATALVLVISSCASTGTAPVQNDPEARKYLEILAKQDRLPGVLSHLPLGEVTETTRSVPKSFPQTRTFALAQNESASTLHYSVIKRAPAAVWELKEAWRTDSAGITVEYFTVE